MSLILLVRYSAFLALNSFMIHDTTTYLYFFTFLTHNTRKKRKIESARDGTITFSIDLIAGINIMNFL